MLKQGLKILDMVDSSFPIKKELHKIIANLNEKGNI
jgi:hypothetical protein